MFLIPDKAVFCFQILRFVVMFCFVILKNDKKKFFGYNFQSVIGFLLSLYRNFRFFTENYSIL